MLDFWVLGLFCCFNFVDGVIIVFCIFMELGILQNGVLRHGHYEVQQKSLVLNCRVWVLFIEWARVFVSCFLRMWDAKRCFLVAHFL